MTPKDSYDAGHSLGVAIAPYALVLIVLVLIVFGVRSLRRRRDLKNHSAPQDQFNPMSTPAGPSVCPRCGTHNTAAAYYCRACHVQLRR